MGSLLCENNLFDRPLFRVDGDLVDHYNRCLEKVRGIRTSLTSFTVDKRGVSPEIIDELGPCYLQNGPSHRYMIILSPDQQRTPLLCEEFSFDNDVIDFFYANCYPAIALATRIDGIYVELDDNVHDFCTADDLLLVRKITMEGHTPSGFLTKARELQGYVAQIQKDPELLVADDSTIPRKILSLVNDIGDVRGYNLTSTRQSLETGNFFSPLFGGVYIFREKAENVVPAKRPSGSKPRKSRLLPEDSPESPTGKITAIFCRETQTFLASEMITRITFSAPECVLGFLLSNGYASCSADLIDARICRVEDEHLLSKGVAIASATYEERCRLLEAGRDTMPPLWQKLMHLKREIQLSGSSFREIMGRQDVEVRKVLLKSDSSGSTGHMVAHLLTRLFPFDYENMLVHNTADLNNILVAADENKRRYILTTVQSTTLHWRQTNGD
jgi:hypothetical protein